MSRRSIVTVATLKGGSGKSTLASCLAVHWRLNGRNPVLVDADPQRTLARLAERPQALGGVPVVEDSSADVVATARRLSKAHAPVVIDTAGFRAPATLAALAEAGLVVVPVKASPLDVDVMIEPHERCLRRRRRHPRFRCVMMQTTRDSVIARHIRTELTEAGFPLLESELVNRIVYGEAALFGATPSMIEPRGAAAREIAALAYEIDALLAPVKETR